MLHDSRGDEHKDEEEHEEDGICTLDAGKRVIGTVAEDGHRQGEKAVPEAGDRTLLHLGKLRPAIERAHEDREDAMSGDGAVKARTTAAPGPNEKT